MINLSGFRPENVLFGGRIKVKETLKRTQAGLAHGSVAARDAAVLASSGALSGPGSTLTTGATLLATDGFAAGKANQMLVGMLNFSNAPQTAQFLAQNHNLAMVGGASLGLASLYASKFPIGFLNRQAASLADLYPNANKNTVNKPADLPPASVQISVPAPSVTIKPSEALPATPLVNQAPQSPPVVEISKPVFEAPKPIIPEPSPLAIVLSPASASPTPIEQPVATENSLTTEQVKVEAPAALILTEQGSAANPTAAETTPVNTAAQLAQNQSYPAAEPTSSIKSPENKIENSEREGLLRKAVAPIVNPFKSLLNFTRTKRKPFETPATESPKSEPT